MYSFVTSAVFLYISLLALLNDDDMMSSIHVLKLHWLAFLTTVVTAYTS